MKWTIKITARQAFALECAGADIEAPSELEGERILRQAWHGQTLAIPRDPLELAAMAREVNDLSNGADIQAQVATDRIEAAYLRADARSLAALFSRLLHLEETDSKQ